MENENIDMLEIIFKAREEGLAVINDKDRIFMNQDKANRSKKRKHLNNELERIPYNLK